ncbi:MAG TPA: helix-turn-helix domain-containing protein [Solirubrobacterales bacterium]|nr:helix-turn-helix domain-containing protein [Solirubrobacterales bacterium]
MSKTRDSEPWRGLSDEVAAVIEPELGTITEEILATISREVPEYARPLEGNFGRGIKTGVGEALLQFVALIRDPEAGRGPGREVYVQLGRGEQRQGRTLDSLLAAYRVGARVAWRRIAAAGRRAGLEAEPLTLLAEAIFAYIDELSADSVDGFAAAQAEVEDVRRRRRRELALLLVREPAAEAADLAAAARAAGWTLPARLAAAACAERDLAPVTRRLPPETLATVHEGTGFLVVPDPDGPGRADAAARAAARSRLTLGPAVEPVATAESWTLALALLRFAENATGAPAGLLRADDHLADLLLFEAEPLTARIAARRLAAFADLTPKARERMRETALAHVRHGGNAVEMAAELQIHPQTARYRIARLRELLGDQMDDPDARFELEIALRAGRTSD